MFEQFKVKAEAVGAEVHRLPTKREGVEFVLRLMQDEGLADAPGSYAVWAEADLAQGEDRARLSLTPGVTFEVNRSLAAQARFGVSRMRFALADTGSLVQDQSAIEQRLVSSLPSIHVALVSTANILSGKSALFARIDPRTSRYIAFVTGPSRTADIERVLTIGVHGPERLIIVFVDELGGE